MGMYTEMVAAFDLPKASEKDIKIIKYMLDEGEKPLEVFDEDHPLFHTDRWDCMLRCGSYSFYGKPCHVFEYDNIRKSHALTVRFNLKNYCDEIRKFLDWVYPKAEHSGFVGYYRYEEYEDPTLIYFTDKGIEYR